MAFDLLEVALGFLDQYGLAAMFVLLVLDGAMLMPVLPGEVVMIMGVTQYAESTGDLVGLIALATGAAIVGSLLLYAIARIGGRPLVERHPRLFMMDRKRREDLEEAFQKPVGVALIMLLRVIPLTRVVVNIPAGLAKMKLGRFVIFSSIGMIAFHAGFMWLTFQSQQEGSGVAQQAASLQEAYASPAWDYLQANEAVAILGVLVIGAWISVKSSRRMLKYPEGAIHSIIGYLTVRTLLIGSMVMGAVLAWRPTLVYEIGRAGGLDLPAIANRLAMDPVIMLAYAAAIAWAVGIVLFAIEKRAKRRKEQAETAARREAEGELEAPSFQTLEEIKGTDRFRGISSDNAPAQFERTRERKRDPQDE